MQPPTPSLSRLFLSCYAYTLQLSSCFPSVLWQRETLLHPLLRVCFGLGQGVESNRPCLRSAVVREQRIHCDGDHKHTHITCAERTCTTEFYRKRLESDVIPSLCVPEVNNTAQLAGSWLFSWAAGGTLKKQKAKDALCV